MCVNDAVLGVCKNHKIDTNALPNQLETSRVKLVNLWEFLQVFLVLVAGSGLQGRAVDETNGEIHSTRVIDIDSAQLDGVVEVRAMETLTAKLHRLECRISRLDIFPAARTSGNDIG